MQLLIEIKIPFLLCKDNKLKTLSLVELKKVGEKFRLYTMHEAQHIREEDMHVVKDLKMFPQQRVSTPGRIHLEDATRTHIGTLVSQKTSSMMH